MLDSWAAADPSIGLRELARRMPGGLDLNREFTRSGWRLLRIEVAIIVSVLLTTLVIWISGPGREFDPQSLFIEAILLVLSLLFMLWTVLLEGAAFFRTLHNIDSFESALSHYLNFVFGLGLTGMATWERAIIAALVRPFMWDQFDAYAWLRVTDGELSEESRKQPLARAGGPGIILVDRESAVVLERDGRFSRILGPGLWFLEPFESVREVVHLRPQIRSRKVTDVSAVTKDGVPVHMSLEIEFMIEPGTPPRGAQPEATPYPFSPRAVYRAVYNKMVGGKRFRSWRDLIMYRAQAELRLLVNLYTLDRLVEAETPEPDWPLKLAEEPRREIQAELQRRLSTLDFEAARQKALGRLGLVEVDPVEPNPAGPPRLRRISAFGDSQKLGAEDDEGKSRRELRREVEREIRRSSLYVGAVILRVALGTIHLDPKNELKEALDKYRRQRIDTWKAEWERRAREWEGQGEAADLRERELARAEMQAEMIRSIARGLDQAPSSTMAAKHLLALRMVEALGQMTLEPYAQVFLPDSAIKMIETVRRLYDKDGGKT